MQGLAYAGPSRTARHNSLCNHVKIVVTSLSYLKEHQSTGNPKQASKAIRISL
jgi:hypothetical protein